MARLEIHQFPCLSDSYGVLVHDPDTGATAAIDAQDEDAVRAAIQKTGWQLTDIFVTHHHADHTQGIPAIKAETGATVTGPAGEADKIPTLDRTVVEGDTVTLGDKTASVIETPGHTLGQIAYWFPEEELLFAGDALFALGCGRVFEGTHDQMASSLEKLSALPDATRVYCGHEYTLANAKFAVTIDPDNAELAERAAEVADLRARGEATLPTTIGLERRTNPFLRGGDPAIQAHLGMTGADPAAVFSEIRTRKDRF